MRRDVASRIIAAAIFAAFAVLPKEGLSRIIDKIIAVVNDEVITQRELTWLLTPIYGQYKKEYSGKRLEDKMIEAEDMVLNQLIDDKLIFSEAKRQGIEVTDKEIQAKLQALKNNFETEEGFRDALAAQNITLSELCDRFKTEIMKSNIVYKEVGWKVIITPTEVHDYYDGHIEEFMTPQKAGVLNILIKKGADSGKKGDQMFLIERIREAIKDGREFKDLAKEYSEGPNAENGGDLGLVGQGQMIEELDGVIFSLKPGEVSDIVESPVGYHIFKITTRVPASTVEFEKVKDEIEDLIYKKRISKNLKKWLRELRKDAYISIK